MANQKKINTILKNPSAFSEKYLFTSAFKKKKAEKG